MSYAYVKHAELQRRLRQAGIHVREVGELLGMSPSGVYNKLCGYSRFTEAEMVKVEALLSSRDPGVGGGSLPEVLGLS